MTEYQAAITNAKLQSNMAGTGQTFELLIATAQDMYKIGTLAKEA